jgi:NitT/TauT family transport system substrate-binding protein
MKAELDAQLYLADPKNAAEITKMAMEQTTGFTPKVLWMSLYGDYPQSQGGTPIRDSLVFTFTPQTMQLIDKATAFLHSIKSISVEHLSPDAILPQYADAALKSRGLSSPIGEVKAQAVSPF